MTMMILKGDGSCQGHPDPRYLKYLEKKGKFFLPCFESIALELAMFFEYFLHASNIIRDVVVQKLVTF